MQLIIEKARASALAEIKKYGTPHPSHFALSNEKGQMLAKKLHADKDIALLGTMLMDLKLGECLTEGKLGEHISRSSSAARELLKSFSLDKKKMEKIINCIEAHHGTIPFTCKEAEICANADCYRFLHPQGIFAYFTLLGKRYDTFEECLPQVKKKMDEKKGILTLEISKQELLPYYAQFMALFAVK